MAKATYYLKDKKIDVYEGVTSSSYGVTTTIYRPLYTGIWAYYRQDSGSSTLTTQNTLKVYDTTERAVFVINRKEDLRTKTLAKLKIKFNGRVYDLEKIDDYEGYKDDWKILAKYSATQSYNGIPND